MSIQSGSRLGPYEILCAIGAGGMGEVYQAHDTKLGRDVAIKGLPEAFAHDADRLSRFQREAKVLASLNHPNIAAIYGLEESAGTSYLVMELVPGETLADRIKRDGAIPAEETLAIAKQIAEALEAAHEKGIIHRDLKPANVKVTPEGKVKVLDFGLAKVFAGDESESDPSNSPTLSHAATLQGVILGTAAYMSPERKRGVNRWTNAPTFLGLRLRAVRTAHRSAAVRRRNSFRHDCPGNYKAAGVDRRPAKKFRPLLRWCLEKNPERDCETLPTAWLFSMRRRSSLYCLRQPLVHGHSSWDLPPLLPGCSGARRRPFSREITCPP